MREDKRKKAEEKAQKAAEKAQKAEDREEERARKAEERAKKTKERADKTAQPKRRAEQEGENTDSRLGPSSTTTQQKRRACNVAQTSKRPRLEETDAGDDKCCVCFQAFEEDVQQETGVEWVQCSCTRWLHEDCIVDCIVDSSGKERLCPYCT